jgi:hypothetical protein
MPRWFVGAVILVSALTLWILWATAINTFILAMFTAPLDMAPNITLR